MSTDVEPIRKLFQKGMLVDARNLALDEEGCVKSGVAEMLTEMRIIPIPGNTTSSKQIKRGEIY